MKTFLKLFLTSVSASLFIAATASAASSVQLALNNAYNKGNGNYDVVVKANPNEKLALYVNDKNPVFATANKKEWATFHKVQLTDKSKLSFTQVFKSKNGKNVQKPINYVRYIAFNGNKIGFIHQEAPVKTPAATTTSSDTTSTTNTGVNDTNLSNNNTYMNTNGTTVHSPADTTDGTVPAGATAQCVDGTYSFSQTHSGTCSHHGGVASWL